MSAPKALIKEDGKSQAAISANNGDFVIKSQDKVDISGSLYSKGDLKVIGKDINIVDTNVAAKEIDLQAQKQLYSNSNYIISDAGLSVKAGIFKDDMNKYDIGGIMEVNAADIVSRLGNFSVGKGVTIVSDNFFNHASKIASNENIKLDIENSFKLSGGDLLAKGRIDINTNQFMLYGYPQNNSSNNIGGLNILGSIFAKDILVDARESIINNNGVIHSENSSTFISPNFINSGSEVVKSDDDSASYKKWYGNILSNGSLAIKSDEIENNASIDSLGTLNISTNHLKNNGLINGAKKARFSVLDPLSFDLPLSIMVLENNGTISAGDKLKMMFRDDSELLSTQIINNGYLIGRSLDLFGNALESSGKIYSDLVSFNISDDISIGGDLISGVSGIVASGKINFGKNSRINSTYGIEIEAHDIELYGQLQAPLIKIDSIDRFMNHGDVKVGKRFIFNGDVFENFSSINFGFKENDEAFDGFSVDGSKKDVSEISDSKETTNQIFSGVPIFQATVGKLFKNLGGIVVTDGTKQDVKLNKDKFSNSYSNSNKGESGINNASMVIVGEDAEIENSGALATNKLSITGDNVYLGGTSVDLFGDDSAIYVKAQDSIVVGNLATNNSLEIAANQFAFYADRFILSDGVTLKDKGILDGNRGLFVFANNIMCGKNSLLDINSKIIFENYSQNDSNRTFLLPEVITGKITGNPILQINTAGRHVVTAPLEVAQIVYPNDSIHVYFRDMDYDIGSPQGKRKVADKFENLVLDLAQQEYGDVWYLQPVTAFISQTSNIADPYNTYQVLKYITQYAQALDASLSKAKKELDTTIVAKDNNWRNAEEYKRFTDAVYDVVSQLIIKQGHEDIPSPLTKKRNIQLLYEKINNIERVYDSKGYDQYGLDNNNCDSGLNCFDQHDVEFFKLKQELESKPSIKSLGALNLNVGGLHLEVGSQLVSN